jgi:hypothetical protein
MTVAEFISKWRKVELKERSAAQEHFIDLCFVRLSGYVPSTVSFPRELDRPLFDLIPSQLHRTFLRPLPSNRR